MRKTIFLLLAISYSTVGFSQYSLFGSKSTQKFGLGYNTNGLAEDDGSSVKMQTLVDIAKETCGSDDCQLLSQGDKQGWVSILKGKTEKGEFVFETSDGNSSKASAIEAVKTKFKQHGGKGDPIYIDAFFVYNTNVVLDKLMKVSLNQPFTINLPMNASTGYSWLVVVTDEVWTEEEVTIKKIGEQYNRPAGGGAGKAVGGSGTIDFTFSPFAKGASIIKFLKMAPGVTNPSKAVETKIYKVVVN